MLGHPKLIILDEPSSGVDPVARNGLLNLVGKLTSQKSNEVQSTVLLTTHHMDEADFISDTLMIMNKVKYFYITWFLKICKSAFWLVFI